MEITKEKTFEAWQAALRHILDHGTVYEDDNKRQCREVTNLLVTIESPESDVARPVETLTDFKKWVYPSQREITEMILTKKENPAHEYCYGSRIFNWENSVDQINDFVIPVLKKSLNSRRGFVILADPKKDSSPLSTHIPGLLLLDFKVKNKKINVHALVRSNDIFIGWPANLVQMHVLQKYIAQRINVETGYIATLSTSGQIFEDYREEIERVIAIKG